MAAATKFQNSTAVLARAAEVPNATFFDGCNQAASNACGLGINIGGGAVIGEPNQFTLLDQYGDARTPQVSQVIGGVGDTASAEYPSSGGTEGNGSGDAEFIFAATPSASGDGDVLIVGTANLADLAIGWAAA